MLILCVFMYYMCCSPSAQPRAMEARGGYLPHSDAAEHQHEHQHQQQHDKQFQHSVAAHAPQHIMHPYSPALQHGSGYSAHPHHPMMPTSSPLPTAMSYLQQTGSGFGLTPQAAALQVNSAALMANFLRVLSSTSGQVLNSAPIPRLNVGADLLPPTLHHQQYPQMQQHKQPQQVYENQQQYDHHQQQQYEKQQDQFDTEQSSGHCGPGMQQREAYHQGEKTNFN